MFGCDCVHAMSCATASLSMQLTAAGVPRRPSAWTQPYVSSTAAADVLPPVAADPMSRAAAPLAVARLERAAAQRLREAHSAEAAVARPRREACPSAVSRGWPLTEVAAICPCPHYVRPPAALPAEVSHLSSVPSAIPLQAAEVKAAVRDVGFPHLAACHLRPRRLRAGLTPPPAEPPGCCFAAWPRLPVAAAAPRELPEAAESPMQRRAAAAMPPPADGV